MASEEVEIQYEIMDDGSNKINRHHTTIQRRPPCLRNRLRSLFRMLGSGGSSGVQRCSRDEDICTLDGPSPEQIAHKARAHVESEMNAMGNRLARRHR